MYLRHYKKKLYIDLFIYDLCLLISTNKERFGIVVIQTDDTLSLLDAKFATLKNKEL